MVNAEFFRHLEAAVDEVNTNIEAGLAAMTDVQRDHADAARRAFFYVGPKDKAYLTKTGGPVVRQILGELDDLYTGKTPVARDVDYPEVV